ncbi:pirin family protein [Roseateles sp.]|uniref:pirin family protein n=1 Tax=Roseateles sp. TaxID=1971397 RepID=UPI003BA6E4D4
MSKLKTLLHRATGHAMGPIQRLIDPGALGEKLKPFIFLDFFNAVIEPGFGFGMHPHSGIATLTWQPDTDVAYEDTTGQKGVLKAGGLEWMNSGGGAWHQGHLMGSGPAKGLQLWVAMPPGIEDGPATGHYVPPEAVPRLPIAGGHVQVLLGEFSEAGVRAASPIPSHQAMNYGVLTLETGASWNYHPPEDHDVAWAFVFDGQARVQGQDGKGQLLVLDGPGDIQVQALGPGARVLIGTAVRHPHPLVMGPSSVHTNAASLQAGHRRIRDIAQALGFKR